MDNREPTRVRENRTRVTKPSTPAERIAAVRSIVERGQYAKIDGIMLDLFSASAIVAVYNNLSETNQARYAGLQVGKMARIAFALVK